MPTSIRPDFSRVQIDESASKASQVYELLRAAIISMRFAPGDAIIERELSVQFGVSRTPLREAILRLAAENLVVVKRSGGTFINKIVLREVLEGQVVRDTLEMRIVQLAARNYTPEFAGEFDTLLFRQKAAADRKAVDEFFALDNEFHKLVCVCAGYVNCWKTIHGATGQLDRVRRYAFPKKDNFLKVYKEHVKIYEAIRARNEDAAMAVFQEQLDSTFPTIGILRQLDPTYVIADDAMVSISDIR